MDIAGQRARQLHAADFEAFDWILCADRANVRGVQAERWWHARSCGRIIVIERDTVTHAIAAGPESAP